MALKGNLRSLKRAPYHDLVRGDNVLSTIGLTAFAPGKPRKLVVKHCDGAQHECALNRSCNATALGWFKAGSALNLIDKGA